MKKVFIILFLSLLSIGVFAQKRVHYSGSKHTSSHGGYYKGSSSGSSHKGGHYKNANTGNRYGIHRKRY